MAAHMRPNSARNVGFDRMSLACVCANCCSRLRKTESCVESELACEVRRLEPCEANCAEVRRERSKAARPTALRDMMVMGRHGY